MISIAGYIGVKNILRRMQCYRYNGLNIMNSRTSVKQVVFAKYIFVQLIFVITPVQSMNMPDILFLRVCDCVLISTFHSLLSTPNLEQDQ